MVEIYWEKGETETALIVTLLLKSWLKYWYDKRSGIIHLQRTDNHQYTDYCGGS